MYSSSSPWAGRVLVLAGILLSAINLRTAVTSLTPLLDLLSLRFGFGPTVFGLFGMLPTAAFAVFGVATPKIAHRIGLEQAALLSMLLAALGLLVRPLAGGVLGIALGCIIALAGMGMGNVVLPPLVKRYFPQRVGTVSAAYLTLLQMGTIIPALTAVPLADAAGWRWSMGVWTLPALVAAGVWLVVLHKERQKDSPLTATHDQAVRGGDVAPELAVSSVRLRPWRSPLAWGMTLMFGMTSLISYAMFTWLPKLMTEAGASPAFGGSMVALFAALGLVSALTMPALAVRIRNPFLLVVASALAYAVAFPGLLFAPMMAPVLWVVLLGIGPSTFPLALTLINLRTRTPSGSATLSGFMQGVGYTLSCAGPVVFGLLHDLRGDWVLPFSFLGLCALVMLAGSWQACQVRMLEDEAA